MSFLIHAECPECERTLTMRIDQPEADDWTEPQLRGMRRIVVAMHGLNEHNWRGEVEL